MALFGRAGGRFGEAKPSIPGLQACSLPPTLVWSWGGCIRARPWASPCKNCVPTRRVGCTRCVGTLLQVPPCEGASLTLALALEDGALSPALAPAAGGGLVVVWCLGPYRGREPACVRSRYPSPQAVAFVVQSPVALAARDRWSEQWLSMEGPASFMTAVDAAFAVCSGGASPVPGVVCVCMCGRWDPAPMRHSAYAPASLSVPLVSHALLRLFLGICGRLWLHVMTICSFACGLQVAAQPSPACTRQRALFKPQYNTCSPRSPSAMLFVLLTCRCFGYL